MTTTKISKTSNNVESSSNWELLAEKAKFRMQQSRKDLAKLEAQTVEHTECIRCAHEQFRMKHGPALTHQQHMRWANKTDEKHEKSLANKYREALNKAKNYKDELEGLKLCEEERKAARIRARFQGETMDTMVFYGRTWSWQLWQCMAGVAFKSWKWWQPHRSVNSMSQSASCCDPPLHMDPGSTTTKQCSPVWLPTSPNCCSPGPGAFVSWDSCKLAVEGISGRGGTHYSSYSLCILAWHAQCDPGAHSHPTVFRAPATPQAARSSRQGEYTDIEILVPLMAMLGGKAAEKKRGKGTSTGKGKGKAVEVSESEDEEDAQSSGEEGGEGGKEPTAPRRKRNAAEEDQDNEEAPTAKKSKKAAASATKATKPAACATSTAAATAKPKKKAGGKAASSALPEGCTPFQMWHMVTTTTAPTSPTLMLPPTSPQRQQQQQHWGGTNSKAIDLVAVAAALWWRDWQGWSTCGRRGMNAGSQNHY
ncbi:hypothetical protein C8J57DRAFT_1230638 [Mycena rebaudengoi]|nr:hypothetical protein C8J57DRAFT_1230638 [Mycena rebaudengoi]